MISWTRSLATTIGVALLTAALGVPAQAAPACDTAGEGDYADSITAPADAASDRGDHVAAMRLYAKEADYLAKCAPIDVAAMRARQTVNYDPSNEIYAGPMGRYFDAAEEAAKAHLRADRCRFVGRAREMISMTSDRNERLTGNDAVLARGC